MDNRATSSHECPRPYGLALSGPRAGPLQRLVRRHVSLPASTGDGLVGGTGCMRLVAVTFPPIKAADQFLHAEPELVHGHGPSRGPVTTDPVAVSNDERVLVNMPRRLGGHRTVRYVDRARDMFAVKCLGRTRVDD